MTRSLTAFIAVFLLLSVSERADADTSDASFEPVTAVYRCSVRERPFSVVTQTAPDALHVFIPQPFEPRTVLLPQVEAASGARYRKDGIEAWTKIDTAMFIIDGIRIPPCRLDRDATIWETAKLDGVDFRAVGNKPGWVLEIRERKKIRLRYDSDWSIVEAIATSMHTNQNIRQTVFEASGESGDVRVTLTGEICLDSTSGEAFETAVLVELGDVSHAGCGRALH